MGNWFIGVIGPVFLHFFVTELVAAISGNVLDSSSRVLLSSLLVMPAALYMYRSDEKKNENQDNGKRKTGGNTDGERKRDAGYRAESARCILCCVLCFAAGGLLNLGWSGLLSFLKIQQHFSNAAQEAMLSGQILIQILAMGIFAPLTEELIFRGLLYRRMRKLLSAGQSVILSSLLFAVYHGNVIQMVFAFPMAVILTLLYEKSGKFRYPFLFHMGCNLTAIAVNFVL